MNLDPIEVRVLGCLLEKSMTTPEYYPLTLNAITTASNQKSNREPVMSLAEAQVEQALENLGGQYLVMEKTPKGSRVRKYAHRFADTISEELSFSKGELAVLALLLLRGPQTAGELRNRCQRMFEFGDLEEVNQVLETLRLHKDGPYVQALAREPGRRERRYQHLLGDEEQTPVLESSTDSPEPNATPKQNDLENRVLELEQRLARLEATVASL